MGAAYLKIDAELLRDILRLPHDSQIICSVESETGMIRLLVHHHSIEADAIEVNGSYRRQESIVFAGFTTARTRHPPPPGG